MAKFEDLRASVIGGTSTIGSSTLNICVSLALPLDELFEFDFDEDDEEPDDEEPDDDEPEEDLLEDFDEDDEEELETLAGPANVTISEFPFMI